MRIRAGVSAAIASAGILLAGWQYGAHVTDANASAVTTSTSSTAGSGGSSGGQSSSSAAGTGSAGSSGSVSGSGSTSAGASAKAGGTYQGAVVSTRFGSVQVQVTVKAGVITDVTALHLTDEDRRSVQISNSAAPLLRSEVLSAQSANVQTISGATITSDAYLSSLQAALDAAHF